MPDEAPDSPDLHALQGGETPTLNYPTSNCILINTEHFLREKHTDYFYEPGIQTYDIV